MRVLCVLFTVAVVALNHASAQLPQRLQIPGAVLLQQSRPAPFRTQQRLGGGDAPPPRLLRQRPHTHIPLPAPVRPVVEEPEDLPITAAPITSNSFDEEVNNLGIAALQSAVRQAAPEEEEPVRPQLQFRPERPVPVLRQDIREGSRGGFRQENVPRPLLRQDVRDEGVPIRQPQPVRHTQIRQQAPPQPAPQPIRQPTRGHAPRQPPQHLDEEGRPGRTRKPPVQILKKYRTDNADGSITWGFENEDGTFKEETLGVDCITRGKYGYIDPDGVRREYSYETGNKCDEPEEEEEDEPQRPQNIPQPRKPQFRPAPAQGPQFRPAPTQGPQFRPAPAQGPQYRPAPQQAAPQF